MWCWSLPRPAGPSRSSYACDGKVFRKSRRSTAVSRCCRCAAGGQAARRRTMTTDPPWHATSLFAALDIATGRCDRQVLRASSRHRQLARKFLDEPIEANVPHDARRPHLVIDNYATHKTTADPRLAIAKRPRMAAWHLTPTSCLLAQISGRAVCFALLDDELPAGLDAGVTIAASIAQCKPPSPTSSSWHKWPIQNPAAGPNEPTIFSPRC